MKIIISASLCFLECFLLIYGDIYVPSTNTTYDSLIARFGPRIDESNPLDGYLIPVEYFFSTSSNKNKGCQMIPLTNQTMRLLDYFKATNKLWFALVERGQCSFIKKAKTMEVSFANAVVVGDEPVRRNRRQVKRLIRMGADGDDESVSIPSVFIARSDYELFRFLANEQKGNISGNESEILKGIPKLHVTLLKGENDEEIGFWSSFIATWFVISIPIIFFLCLYILYKNRRERTAVLVDPESGLDPSHRSRFTITPEMLKKYPTFIYQEKEKSTQSKSSISKAGSKVSIESDSEKEICPICLSLFISGEEIRKLVPCSHKFHSSCIDLWLLNKRANCPLCKNDLLVSNEDERQAVTSPSSEISSNENVLEVVAIENPAPNTERRNTEV